MNRFLYKYYNLQNTIFSLTDLKHARQWVLINVYPAQDRGHFPRPTKSSCGPFRLISVPLGQPLFPLVSPAAFPVLELQHTGSRRVVFSLYLASFACGSWDSLAMLFVSVVHVFVFFFLFLNFGISVPLCKYTMAFC